MPTILPIPSRRAEEARPRDEPPTQKNDVVPCRAPVGKPAETPHPPPPSAGSRDEAGEVLEEPRVAETTDAEAHQVPLPGGVADLDDDDDDPIGAGAEPLREPAQVVWRNDRGQFYLPCDGSLS